MRKAIASLTAAMVMAAFVLSFTACDTVSPLGESGPSPQGLVQVVDFGAALTSLTKGRLTATAVVTPEDGGHLVLIQGKAFTAEEQKFASEGEIELLDDEDLSAVDFDGESGFIISLEVLPNSLEEATSLTLTMDRKRFDMDYGPDGTVFANAALLNVIAVNLDLRHVNPESLGVYYYNPESGRWEIIDAEAVVVDIEHGFLRIRNAHIPHFSRYAVAFGE